MCPALAQVSTFNILRQIKHKVALKLTDVVATTSPEETDRAQPPQLLPQCLATAVPNCLATRQIAQVLLLRVAEQQRNDEPDVLQLMFLPDLPFLHPFQQLNLEAFQLKATNSVDQARVEKDN